MHRDVFELLSRGGESAAAVASPRDVVPNQRLSPQRRDQRAAAIALWRLASERVPITVTPVASALLRTERRSSTAASRCG